MLKPEYELTILVITGDFSKWKSRTRAGNILSTPEKVYMGSESDYKFIITWDSTTFINMGDDKVYFLIQSAIKNLSQNIIKKPDARFEFAFKTMTDDGQSPSLLDHIVGNKFDRIIKLLE